MRSLLPYGIREHLTGLLDQSPIAPVLQAVSVGAELSHASAFPHPHRKEVSRVWVCHRA
jgi:hypothetical protein